MTQPQSASHDHGSRIISALESAWEAIRTAHPEVPKVVVITGQGQDGLKLTWGHFAPGSWTAHNGEKKEAVHELFAGGELIAMGGRRVLQTLLHEAAHGLAHVRGVKDTSNKNRYHNQRFAALARELGLISPTKPAPVLGFSECVITDETAERFREVIEALDGKRLPYRESALVAWLRSGKNNGDGDGQDNGDGDGQDNGDGDGQDDGDGDGQDDGDEDEQPTEAGRDGRRHSVACGCEPPRKFQISPKAFELGDITCNVCEETFAVVEPTPRRRRTAGDA